ncbi:MAG TPA: kelch repeat-containing protein, partial [Blastocatellia bacterium]|nr:kelch repeat-containing protein [Blastocatellia bacterium]
MKSHLILTLVARLRSLSARRYSPIFAGSLLLLAAIVGWQLSARFVVAAKSRTAVSTASAAAAPEAGNMCCGTWTQKATTGPSQRYRDAMAYARNCNRVVLFGGLGNGPNPAGALDDTWEWDGTTMTWTQFSPAVKPPARGGHTMAYDSARNRVVLFGGLTGSFSVFNDTWEYNCSTHTWTQMNPANSPPGRFGHAMAYDPNLGVSVINGGQSTNQDTWTWNGTNWTQVAGGNQPGIRYDHGMAFDGLRVILFGGNKNAGLAANDTWGFTGTAWTQLAVTGPSQGERLGLAQDPAAGRVILFGGSNSISNYTNDTWEWNGANLTWCQATLTAPQPAGREYPAMAFDGRGVIFHAGLNSGLVTLADTWRYQGSRTYTFRAGLMDNFASPNDPTSPRAVLVTQFNNPVRKNFDDATVDSWVLHSFTGLPSNIVSAELEVRMQPGLGGSTNDSINFAFPPNTSVTWGQQMAALPGAGGSWNIGHAPTTFILDLANLPAGATGQPTNLLSLLNTHHLLDIAIQDDTTVDYIKLRVVTCPPRRYFAGFPHEPFNDTTLSLLTSPTGVEQLQVNPSPTGRTDVKTVLGQVAGWRADLLPTTDLRQPGRVMESWVKGRVNGVDDQFIGKSSITGNGSSATFMADFSNIGSPTSLVELLDPNGLLVGSFTAPNAAAIQFMCPTGTQTITTCTTQWVCEPNGDKTQVTFCNTICVSYNNQSYNNVSTMRVTALNITQPREFVSEGVICGVNLGGLTLTGESLIVGGRPVQSLGIASLEPFASGIAVEGAGSSGQDGAQIDLGMAENYTVSIDTIDPMNIAAVGTALTVSTTHVSTVLPPPPPKDDAISVTRVRPDDSLPTGIIEIAADFSQLGANSMRVTAFNGATQVADMTNFTGKVLTSAWPVAMGKIGSTSLGYKLDFPSGTLAAFRPCSPPCDQQFTITSLQVLPTNPNVGTAYFRQNRWTFSPGGISGFTVTGLAITPFCNSTITLSPTSLAVAAVNQPYSQQLTASGGVAPYRFSVTAGALN